MVSTAMRLLSMKREKPAPRLRASMPTAPVPAKRSRKAAPARLGRMILKSDSLARSVMGRVLSPGTERSRRPRAEPAFTCRGLMALRGLSLRCSVPDKLEALLLPLQHAPLEVPDVGVAQPHQSVGRDLAHAPGTAIQDDAGILISGQL